MYYILLRKQGNGDIASTIYGFLTTTDNSGTTTKKSFATIQEAQAFVQDMVTGGETSLNSFIVVKGVTVSAALTLADEVVDSE